jgi:hypothetical protein
LEVKPLPIEEFVNRLQSGEGFCFARYGDGTFFAMQGKEGTNCDGALIRKDQAQLLIRTIKDATITHGIGDLALSDAQAGQWLQEQGLEIEWYDCNVMHNASLRGTLRPFIELLRKRKTALIGAKHLRHFSHIPIQNFIETSSSKAFYEMDYLQAAARKVVTRNKLDTVLVSAGTAAPVLVSRLHKDFPHINVIDTGSVWDPYAGVLSRKVFRQLGHTGIRALEQQNFK